MIAIHRIAVLEAFDVLADCLMNVEACLLSDASLPAWVQDASYPLSLMADYRAIRQSAYRAISQLEYSPDQDPRAILLCPGFIAASDKTLVAVRALNDAKKQFKSAVLALKHAKQPLNDPSLNEAFENRLRCRDKKTASVLKKMGLARLHLKQCYRILPVLDKAPKKLRWTWANTRAIKRITVEEAVSRLSRRANDPTIALQLAKLHALNPKEPLAIVQELAPHLRVNIVFSMDDDASDERLMVKGPVPIFYPADSTTPIPDFKPPAEKKGRDANRPIRSDVKLEPQPFIQALRAHRYHILETEDN